MRTKLSLTNAVIILLAITFISVLANYVIQKQFEEYITKQKSDIIDEIATDLSMQYNNAQQKWELDYLNVIGMNAINDGYIVTVLDSNENIVWNAESYNQMGCSRMMHDISHRMETRYPNLNGQMTTQTIELSQMGQAIGKAEISYYGPFFLNENDTHFLDKLNGEIVAMGISSILVALIISALMAKKVSSPILKTANVAKQMADGDYATRILEKSTTKELTLLTNSFNNLAETLEQQEKLRKQLTADVAHELRTPLTTISTHTEAMIEGIWEPTPERLSSFHEEIERITEIVLDLENLAQIESGKVNLKKTKIDLLDVVKQTLATFELEIMNKKLDLTVEGQPSLVFADEKRLSQVVHNLFSNAIKYTLEGGLINVSMLQTDKNILLSVTDNGNGISPAELPNIFERFYRADKSRNRSTGGSGIGLSIVRSLVNAHGGRVWVESELNKGSCFTVELPKNF